MASISRITAAPLAATSELTAALGVLNFDFSLMKLEAPSEYKALGATLSSSRRAAAEDGDLHSTARKLRSLFDRVIPETPELTKAYGIRVSEIANSNEFVGQPGLQSGPFTEHLGMDGSSIWAAATSGANAIAIHLLGCMLARMWPAAEATSIWEELVQRRKKDVSRLAGSNPEEDVYNVIMKMHISRENLATWDASARAWLRAADEYDRKKDNKQKKLHLIVDNVRLPVNGKGNTYESVIHAWVVAMKTVDYLLAGVPQSIQDGSALLGLSSWHLYPEMLVLGPKVTTVKLNDPLFNSEGILTLGLSYVGRRQEIEAPQAGEEGIYWSLPLAHLRYYGRPVLSSTALSMSHARLTLNDLTMIALGSMFRSLGKAANSHKTFMRCLVAYWNTIEGAQNDGEQYSTRDRHQEEWIKANISRKSWLAVLAGAAKLFLDAQDEQRSEALKLFNIGRRRDLKFLVHGQQRPPAMFGLCASKVLLRMLQVEDRIELLRRAASELDYDPDSLIIRYRRTDGLVRSTNEFGLVSVASLPTSIGTTGRNVKEAQSSCGMLDTAAGAKESSPDDYVEPRSHFKWTVGVNHTEAIQSSHEQVQKTIMSSDIVGPLEGSAKFFWSNAPFNFCKKEPDTVTVDHFFGQFAEFALFKGNADPRNPRKLTGIPFDFILGDPNTAAIYHAVDIDKVSRRPVPDDSEFSIEDVDWALSEGKISQGLLLDEAVACTQQFPLYYMSLKTLATVHNIFSPLEGATFPMSVTSSPLYQARWLLGDRRPEEFFKESGIFSTNYRAEKIARVFEPFATDRAMSFACISSFELGGRSVSREGLQDVMALSTGDSIFMSASLIRDPAESVQNGDHELVRVRGNIGRAGIALMVPPRAPEIRAFDEDHWRLVNHADFDGTVKDCFGGTSLHLSFTGWIFPVDIGEHGACDTEVYILETLISVHDQGKWVADLDILGSIKNNMLRPISAKCKHVAKETIPSAPRPSNKDRVDESSISLSRDEVVSIDCWDEFLDFPTCAAVVRAKGNWLARLAFATTSVQRGYLTLLLGSGPACWICAGEERERFRHKSDAVFIV